MGRCDGQRHELAARALGARGGALAPEARRRAGDPLFAALTAPRPGAREPAQGSLLPRRCDDGLARMAAVDGGGGAQADPERAAALLRAPLLDDVARAGDARHCGGDGRFGRGGRVRPAGRRAGRARGRRMPSPGWPTARRRSRLRSTATSPRPNGWTAMSAACSRHTTRRRFARATASFPRGSHGYRPSRAGGRCGACSSRPASRRASLRCSGRRGDARPEQASRPRAARGP